MSMQYCDRCNKQIDTDFDAEHFDEIDVDGVLTHPWVNDEED